MKVGSLFSGIGGFDLGLERAGFQTAWFCEQDEFCQRVLRKHWPDVPIYDDICELRGQDVEPVDALCGGFPCQDLSTAGRGAGIEGERSGLWSEYARLIGELRPKYVFVENVAALLARGLGRVLGDLAALGYDAEWDCIPASAFGAPHRRDRIWLVAYPMCEGLSGRSLPSRDEEKQPWFGNDRPHGELADSNEQRCDWRAGESGTSRRIEPEDSSRSCAHSLLADTDSWGSSRPRELEYPSDSAPSSQGKTTQLEHGRFGSVWTVEPNVGRVADGVPARVDRLRALGNALVPQVAEWIGCRIQEWEEGR